MATIVAANVAYAQTAQYLRAPGRPVRQFKLTFPTTATTSYVAGGVPLDLGKLGCLRGVASLKVLGRTPNAGAENPSYEWNGNATTPTLVAFETNTAGSPAAEFDAATNYTQNGQIVFIEVEGA